MTATLHSLEVNPQIPARLKRLEDLANNLWYSWYRPARGLFIGLSRPLWMACDRNPKALLQRISQERLNEAASDPAFLQDMDRVIAAFDAYLAAPPMEHCHAADLGSDDLVAYFCAEFGFHESLPIYSGGLGILAGDHCKAASDAGLPFIGVGLLYRQGFFHQSFDADGRQQATHNDSDFDALAVKAVTGPDGHEVHVSVEMPGRLVQVKLWELRVGRVRIILLDTCLPENTEADRGITRRLYIGERSTRLEQELILGVGGVRALEALGLQPTVWHVNEGHSAFLILDRIRRLIGTGLPFAAALEAVAASVVFSTHTPVAAGHDHFREDLVRQYFAPWRAELGEACNALLALGMEPGQPDFNMTTLGIRGSRHHNGVSRIHGGVSSVISRHLWPQIEPEDNPIGYVTNGVHLPTFVADEWQPVFDQYLGPDWLQHHMEVATWEGIHRIPDAHFWQVHQQLKSNLLHMVMHAVREQHLDNQGPPTHIEKLLKLVDPEHPDVLTIGFARRFATYKRADLLLHDPDRLLALLTQAGRPVLFLFAGKAHPDDQPGQEIIRRIAEMARRPEFEGRLLLLPEYNLHLARRMVAGVDVWLNNPISPLEASGTSGMKAAMNGAVNLSVLDGWWAEGYETNGATAGHAEHAGSNGWAIYPAPSHLDQARRDAEEAQALYEILEDHVLPAYYERPAQAAFPPGWVGLAKRSMASVAPRFNAARMLGEYVNRFYAPAAAQGRRYAAQGHAAARELAAWKARVSAAWPGVRLRRIQTPTGRIPRSSAVRIEVAVHLGSLQPQDIALEALFSWTDVQPCDQAEQSRALAYQHDLDHGEALYALTLEPELCGRLSYRIRAYPTHPLLTHRFEMGCMVWL